MPTHQPYLSVPGLPRLMEGCAGQNAVSQTSVGVLRVLADREEDGAQRFIPTHFRRSDGSASLAVDRSGPRIRVRGTRGWLVMTADGFTLRGQDVREGEREIDTRIRRELVPDRVPRMQKYDERGAQRLAKALIDDVELRASFIALNRDLWLATLEHALATDTLTSTQLTPTVTAVGDNIGGATEAPPADACSPERKVTVITEHIYGWVESVKSAATQAAECASGCDGKPWYAWPVCMAACAIGFFKDIITRTWELLRTVTHELVEWTLCPVVGILVGIPAYTTAVPSATVLSSSGVVPIDPRDSTDAARAIDITPLTTAAGAVLECLATGDWRVWRHDFAPEEEGRTPIGVEVCVDARCVASIRAAFSLRALAEIPGIVTALTTSGGAAGVIAALLKIPAIKAGTAAIAAAAGITVAEAAALLLGLLIMMAYQATAIAAQLKFMELTGGIPGGVCLRHPSLLLGAGFFLFPAVALSWPITVARR